MEDADLDPPNIVIPPGNPASAPAESDKSLREASLLEPIPDASDDGPSGGEQMRSVLTPISRSSDLPALRKPPADDRPVTDTLVTHLFINPYHTTGVDIDGKPGDDALRIVLEPRNDARQCVPQAGEMTIALLDPAKSGDAARIAKWDLSKRAIGEGILDARPERGMKLDLPWPERPPENAHLKLFVRYRRPDGQQIEAHSDVYVHIAGQLNDRWTPRMR
jgi:hypothetical protein